MSTTMIEPSPEVVPQRIQVGITGMTCVGCANTVERALKRVDGVRSAAVNIATEVATLEVVPGTPLERIEQAVQQAGYGVQAQPNARRVVLEITGMTCAGCARTVEQALGKLTGVQSASVNIATETATLTLDPEVRESILIDAVKAAGYGVRESASEREDDTVPADPAAAALAHARKRMAIAWIFTTPIVALMALHMTHVYMVPNMELIEVLLALPVLAWAGAETFAKAFKTTRNLSPTMDVLIALGASASFATGVLAVASAHFMSFAGVGAMIMTFHLTGRYLEALARGRASQAIRGLIELGAKTARVMRNDVEVEVSIRDVRVNDVMVVRPGERVPTDGKVISGESAIDESLATGESLPVDKKPGDDVIGASINTTGMLMIRATKVGKDTFLAQVVRIVQEAQGSKVPIQELADRVTAIFVPFILALALATFAIWMFAPATMHNVTAWAATWLPWSLSSDMSTFSMAVFSAVAVLVIACPCAMGLATPAALMVGTGKGASKGILIRNGEAIQTMRLVRAIAFDKTGTLTFGKPAVTDVQPVGEWTRAEVLHLAVAVERSSEHPIAQAIVRAAEDTSYPTAESFNAVPGKGAIARIDGHEVVAGKPTFLVEQGVDTRAHERDIEAWLSTGHSLVLIARDRALVGAILVADTIKDNARDSVDAIRALGITPIMITGDNEQTARAIAQKAGIDRILANVLPSEKRDAIVTLQREFGVVAMVGDGINDAAALAQADIGIAIGTGTDIAIESSDITLVSGDLSVLTTAIRLSKATFRTIQQNLFWAFGYNIIAIPLAVAGLLHPVVAEICMAASSINVLLNSMRLRRFH